jgi:signal transduction histidine kinase
MEIVVWVLVAVLAVAVAVLLFRRPEGRYAVAADRLARELERGAPVRPAMPDDPPEVASLRRVVAEGWEPVRVAEEEDPGDRALRGLVRYLRGAALEPLQQSLRNGDASGTAVQEVVDALEDLEFYAAEPEDEAPSRQNLPTLIQEVAREYTRETDIPVKLSFSSPTIPAAVPTGAFKDALFLLLSNAGRFGRGQTVVVEAERTEEGARVRVLDRGEGFSPEALEHAFEPFWSTDRDAVGLGLTHARRLLHPGGIRLRVANREEGGGEAVISVPVG